MPKEFSRNQDRENPIESKQIVARYDRGSSGRTFYLVTPEVEIAANRLADYFPGHTPTSTNWSAFRHNFNELANLSDAVAHGKAGIESVRRFAEELIMMVNLDIKNEGQKH